MITGLPRAIANHATNSIHFGPDGKLYIAQGGNTGAGAPNDDPGEFGDMQEQPLSAALLVADVDSPSFDGSCDNTADIFGPPPCDVTTFSTGLRNMYDFVFHSNGSIYGPDNGLGVVGTFPPSPTPPCLGMADTAPWNADPPGHNPGPPARLPDPPAAGPLLRAPQPLPRRVRVQRRQLPGRGAAAELRAADLRTWGPTARPTGPSNTPPPMRTAGRSRGTC